MKLKITVTDKDIINGRPANGESCPIALACRRLGYLPSVDGEEISLECCESGDFYTATTPKRAARFIEKFDEEEKVKPFEFTITARKGQNEDQD